MKSVFGYLSPAMRSAWFVLVLGLSLAPTALAGPPIVIPMEDGADAAITLSYPLEVGPYTGFMPLFVRIENRATGTRVWEFSFTLNENYFRSGATVCHYRAEVPGQTIHEKVVYLSVPFTPAGSGGTALRGEVHGPSVNDSNFNQYLNYGPSLAFPAVTRSLASSFLGLQAATATPPTAVMTLPAGPAAMIMPGPAVVDFENWPADWRAWSSFGVFFVEENEWTALDAAHRKAVLDWVALGGRLVISPRIETRQVRRTPQGAGELVTLRAPLGRLQYKDLLDFGLGDLSRLENPGGSLMSLVDYDDQTRWALVSHGGWVSLFLVAFGLVIGPVNLFVFAPAGRRQRLFFTVPMLSLAATAILAGAIFFQDGLGGAGTRRALVVLLPGENQAAVFQRQVARTGLLTGRSFKLPSDTFLKREPDSSAPANGRSQEQLERNGEEASGDWFTSRARQTHLLQRLTPTRARVELVGVDPATAAPTIQSTLTTTLRDFLYIGPKGKLWGGVEVPPGQRDTLAPYSSPPVRDSMSARVRTEALLPGHFYAFGGATDLAPIATLPSIRWTDDSVVYTGVVEDRP